MSAALHLLSNNIPGHGPSESGNLPYLGAYGSAMGMAARPPCVKTFSKAKGLLLKCSSGRMSFLCKASSNSQRKNLRQNRQGFSQNKNRQNEERDSSDHLEESDFLSSKNGPLLPFSKATAGPGPREREIVELFRKVQAQLRERATAKEEKKFEVSRGRNKGNETVDSLLKLLRKHSVEQGKRKVNGGSVGGIEVNLDQPGWGGTSNEDKSRSFFNPISSVRDESQEDKTSSPNRPPSNFRRRSPVPRMRYESIISGKETISTVSAFEPDEKSRKTGFPSDPIQVEADSDTDTEFELNPEVETEVERDADLEASFAYGNIDGQRLKVEDETLASQEANDDDEASENEGEEKPATEHKDLDAMKLQELRELAKARGIRRYSKLKKSELIGLLSEDGF